MKLVRVTNLRNGDIIDAYGELRRISAIEQDKVGCLAVHLELPGPGYLDKVIYAKSDCVLLLGREFPGGESSESALQRIFARAENLIDLESDLDGNNSSVSPDDVAKVQALRDACERYLLGIAPCVRRFDPPAKTRPKDPFIRRPTS
jgi:hypothetical protein